MTEATKEHTLEVKGWQIREASLRQQFILAAAIAYMIVAGFGLYALGRWHGFDRGCIFSEQALERALVEGIKDGMPYRMDKVAISFRPWKARQDTATIRLHSFTVDQVKGNTAGTG